MKKSTIEDMHKLAATYNGQCLSLIYINSRTKLPWKCSIDGHNSFLATPSNVKQGYWCRLCGYARYEEHEERLKIACQIAKDRGGECLSTAYLGDKDKLHFRCIAGHKFFSSFRNIKNAGSWCSDCTDGIGERLTRHIFETLFNKQFPKKKPKWLQTEKTNRIELDGFCEELGIAFEYNGLQHYQDVDIFTRPKYDEHKKEKCQERNVKLFSIRQLSSTSQWHTILDEIKTQSKQLEVEINTNLPIDINKVYQTNDSILRLKEIQEIAYQHNGECFSNSYLGNDFKLSFKCNICNHLWENSSEVIRQKAKSGNFCPNCAGVAKKSIGDMISFAAKYNGKCLSNKYFGNKKLLQWQCEDNHLFDMSFNHMSIRIKQGKLFCPQCKTHKEIRA